MTRIGLIVGGVVAVLAGAFYLNTCRRPTKKETHIVANERVRVDSVALPVKKAQLDTATLRAIVLRDTVRKVIVVYDSIRRVIDMSDSTAEMVVVSPEYVRACDALRLTCAEAVAAHEVYRERADSVIATQTRIIGNMRVREQTKPRRRCGIGIGAGYGGVVSGGVVRVGPGAVVGGSCSL